MEGVHMEQDTRAVVEKVFQQAIKNMPSYEPPALPLEAPTIDCSELPELSSDRPLHKEWNHYRREVQRLIVEGHENRFVLIKGDEIIGIWDTQEEVKDAALQKFLMQPCLIHQIRRREPVIKMSARFWDGKTDFPGTAGRLAS
jgi:hypothetical protein